MVVFNGAHLGDISDKLYIIDVVVHDPAINQTVVAPALANGDIFAYKKYESRQVDVLFAILEEETSARSRIIHAINEWADSSTEKELRVPQEPDGYLMAVCSKFPQDSANAFGDVLTVSFECHDPFFYANTENSAVVPGGLIYVQKAAAPPWRIECNVPELLSSPLFGIGDKQLIFSAIPAGKLVIERKRQTATLNGQSILPSLLLGSRFFDLGKGGNIIDTQNSYIFTLFWRERWL